MKIRVCMFMCVCVCVCVHARVRSASPLSSTRSSGCSRSRIGRVRAHAALCGRFFSFRFFFFPSLVFLQDSRALALPNDFFFLFFFFLFFFLPISPVKDSNTNLPFDNIHMFYLSSFW